MPHIEEIPDHNVKAVKVVEAEAAAQVVPVVAVRVDAPITGAVGPYVVLPGVAPVAAARLQPSAQAEPQSSDIESGLPDAMLEQLLANPQRREESESIVPALAMAGCCAFLMLPAGLALAGAVGGAINEAAGYGSYSPKASAQLGAIAGSYIASAWCCFFCALMQCPELAACLKGRNKSSTFFGLAASCGVVELANLQCTLYPNTGQAALAQLVGGVVVGAVVACCPGGEGSNSD